MGMLSVRIASMFRRAPGPRAATSTRRQRIVEGGDARWVTISGVNVLIWANQAYDIIPGGHRVQIDRSAEALRCRGVSVTVDSGPGVSLENVDLVHSFSARPEWVRRARQARIPVVVSTIYWNQRYVLGLDKRRSPRQRTIRAVRLMGSAIRRGPELTASQLLRPIIDRQLIFESADLLLPNSMAEAKAIRTELAVSTPAHVVPNGVDHYTFTLPSEPGPRRGVLYVGRIEPHKNQLGLINALAGTQIPLTIVGPVHPHHRGYMDKCRRAAGPETRFVNALGQDALVALYREAAVHAMPSWFETTGLSSLEACLCGAAVVTTDRGYAHEYFQELAYYCDPSKPRSIRAAIEAALKAGGSAPLRERILRHYTWEHAADATIGGYEVAGRGAR